VAASPPTLHRLSPDVYDRIVASGVLDGEPVELIDGLLVHVSPQGPEHAALIQWFTARFAARADLLRVQLPLAVPGGRPEPDVALAESVSAHQHPETAELVVEVAQTSWAEDVAKLRGYASAGVGTAWLVDVPGRAVHVHERPGGGAYASSRALRGTDALVVPVAGVSPFTVDELFAVLDR
jgi:Uma2 family endonuclease